MQVDFARIQALAVLRLGAHADCTCGLAMVVQHHHILVVGQLGLRELARRPLHGQRVGATRHRQHEVERLAPVADVLNEAAAIAPVVGQLAHRFLAAWHGLCQPA